MQPTHNYISFTHYPIYLIKLLFIWKGNGIIIIMFIIRKNISHLLTQQPVLIPFEICKIFSLKTFISKIVFSSHVPIITLSNTDAVFLNYFSLNLPWLSTSWLCNYSVFEIPYELMRCWNSQKYAVFVLWQFILIVILLSKYAGSWVNTIFEHLL